MGKIRLTDSLHDRPCQLSAPHKCLVTVQPRSKLAACNCLPTLGFNSEGYLVVADKSICVHEHLCTAGVVAIG